MKKKHKLMRKIKKENEYEINKKKWQNEYFFFNG